MKKGFTLVELLAVIAILAILVIIAMPNIMDMYFSAKEDTFETEMKTIYDFSKSTYIKDSIFSSEKRLYCNTPDCEGEPLDMDIPDNLKYSVKLNKRGEVMCFQATNGTFYYVSQGVVDEMDFAGNVYYTDDSTVDFVPDCYYSVDYKNIKRINVLNIYPDNTTRGSYKVTTREGTYSGCNNYKKYMSSSLKNWMEDSSEESENGYGKGIIKVIPVSFTEFNSNPDPNYWVKKYYDDGCISSDDLNQGEILNTTKADMIFIGTWDANANTAYSSQAITAIKNWTNSGKPIIAGHDVLIKQENESKEIASALENQFGMDIRTGNSSMTNRVHILSNKKRNVFTLWPWIIVDTEAGLEIPTTHATGQYVTSGEVWITLGGTKITEEVSKNNKFYLATYNNTAMIQTGHSKAQATPDEQKIIANTIFFMYYKHVLKENGDEL